MSLDPNKTYLVWNGTEFPKSTASSFKAPAGSTIDWGDGTVETFDTASTSVNTHTYTDGKTEHTIAISGLTSISTTAFSYCRSLTSVTIGNSVTRFANYAFSYCSSLTSVTIPNSVTIIGAGAFAYCSSLTSVSIPDSVTSIGSYAFGGCTNLIQLILFPSTPPTVDSSSIPNNVQSIYVQQSSKAAYQAATNWTAFASKIVSDNIYLSFVRFNQKNKEYIDNGLSKKLTVLEDGRVKVQSAPVDDDDVVRKGDLSGVGTKLYKHRITINFPIGSDIMFIYVTGLSSHNIIINTIALLEENSTLLADIANVSYMGPKGNGGGVFSYVRYNNTDAVYMLNYDFGGSNTSLSLANFTSITDTITEI